MKKNIILGIAAVALLLSSCSKKETDKNGQILPNDPSRIGLGINTGSKGVEVDLPMIEILGGKIDIVAVKNGGGNKTQLFNEKYVFADSRWDWTADPTDKDSNLFKWPNASSDYPMIFYSFLSPRMPLDDVNTLNYIEGVGAPNIPITIYDQIEAQEDLLVALTVVDEAPSNGRANFSLKHLLSKVRFKIQGTENATITIPAITVVNVQNEKSRPEDSAPAYNPITGWINPITTAAAAGKSYISYLGTTRIDLASPIEIKSKDEVEIVNFKGPSMLMPQYGTPIWKTSVYSAAAALELKDAIYAKTEDGKFTPEAINQWNTNVRSKIEGSYIEVIYNLQNADKSSYIIGKEDQYIRVGYPLDLTADADGKSWKQGKQYTYVISLGTADATGGTLLDPFYVDQHGNPTTDPVNNPASVKPGDPINTLGRIGFNLDVAGWVDAPAAPIK